jgi:hypothetical protein
VDVNGDGKLDVLSGSYSRSGQGVQDMAGLFQVLYGEGNGKYREAEALKGTDGEPLILPRKMGGEDEETNNDLLVRICTRPTAVDFDGDGKLDIVSGNFAGTFFLFRGEGGGKFAPAATPLVDRKGKELRVDSHSDPVFFDWDSDGDLDLLSGSAAGGVMLATNVGGANAPAFDGFVKVLPQAGDHGDVSSSVTADDSHLTQPGRATRIWVDDVNGDGKADLLIGDATTLITPVKGVPLEDARMQYVALVERQQKVWETPDNFDELPEDEQAALREEQSKRAEELEKEFQQVVDRQMTGFVWIYHRK